MWREYSERFRATPFGRLTSHFYSQFFASEFSVRSSEPSGSSSLLVLGMVAMPGLIMSVMLFFLKYSPLMRFKRGWFTFDREAASLTDKWNFILLTVVLTGLVTLLRYGTLIPDRRDFWNLAALPLRMRAIFFAKLLALAMFLAVFVFAQNVFATVLFPFAVLQDGTTLREFVLFVVAHAVSVSAAAVFTFSAVLGMLGLLVSVLPHTVYRQVWRYVQFAGVSLLLLLFFLAPAFQPGIEALRRGETSWVAYFPPVWFLGLYCGMQQIHSGLDPLPARALAGLAIALVVAALAYALTYRMHFLKSAEVQELPHRARALPATLYSVLDHLLLFSPLDRGGFRFGFKTLVRSERHVAVLAATLGIASALVVQSVSAVFGANIEQPLLHPAALSVPITILYFLIVGQRVAFGVVADARSVWLFQSVLGVEETDPRSVARKMMMVSAAPVVALSAAVYAFYIGWSTALFHAGYLAITSALLVEGLLRGLPGIPFTTPMLPAGGRLVPAICATFSGYLFYTGAFAGIEAVFLRRPAGLTFFFLILGAALWALHHGGGNARIEYEPAGSSFELLRLSE